MPKMKGADLIAEYLIANKIPYVFGICGHGNVGMLDALYHARDRIKLVSPRHEQVAAHMADAYFRVRHEPVATLTSCVAGCTASTGTAASGLLASSLAWLSARLRAILNTHARWPAGSASGNGVRDTRRKTSCVKSCAASARPTTRLK